MDTKEILSANIDVGMVVVLFIVVAIVIGGFVAYVAFRKIEAERESIVLENSEQIAKITHLNQRYKFIDLKNESIRKFCNSKKMFERTYLDEVLKNDLEDNLEYYAQIIKDVRENKTRYQDYISEYGRIISTISEEKAKSLKLSLATFQKVEKRICDSLKLKPILTVCIYVKKSYSSPQGRNNYYDERSYTFEQWGYYYKEALEAKKRKESHAYQVQKERGKMTDSMRYDVMRRDGFRCVLCGAKASDVVQLHVDHIFPVSRGGKTVMSNLRTLCSRCNQGKGCKVE